MPSSVTFERQIEIIRHKFRKDAGALAFVDNFEAAIEEIDEWFGVSGLVRNEKLRTLTRKIVFEAKGDLRQRLKRALLTHYSSVGLSQMVRNQRSTQARLRAERNKKWVASRKRSKRS